MPNTRLRLAAAVERRDGDLLLALDTLDRALYRLVDRITAYRGAVSPQRLRLRHGEDPRQIRAALERWAPVLREIRRVAKAI